MDRRFVARRDELLADAEVAPQILHGILPRLERFLDPFVASLQRSEQDLHARHYVAGLLSNLEYKNVESIAYLHDQQREPLQQFIGQSPWEHRPLITQLVRSVAGQLGCPDAVLVFDPSAFAKKGQASVGVQRQWCGRLGKVENCQVGVYLGYVSLCEHALLDCRLYLPREWTADRPRCDRAGIPRTTRFQTRHALALEMLDEHREALPHAWVAGDDEMGRSSSFRRALAERQECYLLAVPSNTLIRDLEALPPAYGGRGRHPVVPFGRVDRWGATLPEGAWTEVTVRDGDKGPLVVGAVKRRVQARTEGRRVGPEEVLVVVRQRQEDGTWKHDYYLSNGSYATELREFTRVANAGHRIEECLQRAKGEAGLADYEVRTWRGWHHHQTLALVATWFLTEESRRGKKMDTGVDGFATAEAGSWGVAAAAGE
jgi:SRSO17 transposase